MFFKRKHLWNCPWQEKAVSIWMCVNRSCLTKLTRTDIEQVYYAVMPPLNESYTAIIITMNNTNDFHDTSFIRLFTIFSFSIKKFNVQVGYHSVSLLIKLIQLPSIPPTLIFSNLLDTPQLFFWLKNSYYESLRWIRKLIFANK